MLTLGPREGTDAELELGDPRVGSPRGAGCVQSRSRWVRMAC